MGPILRIFQCAFGLLLVLTSATVAAAQSFITDDYAIPVLPAKLYSEAASNPIEALVTLVLEADAGMRYETNVFHAPSGARTSDFVFTASPRAIIRINSGDITGKIELGSDINVYAANSANNQVDLYLRSNLDFALSENTTLFTRASVRRDERGIEANGATPLLTPVETKTALIIEAEIGIEHRSVNGYARASIGMEATNFDGLQQTGNALSPIDNDLLDRTTFYANAEAGRNISAQASILGGLDLAVNLYAKNAPLNPARNSVELRPYVGATYQNSQGNLTASARVGAVIRSFSNIAYDTIIAPTFSGEVRFSSYDGAMSVFASTSTDINETSTPGVGAVIDQAFKLGATVSPSRSLQFSGALVGAFNYAKKADALGGGINTGFNLGGNVDARWLFLEHSYLGLQAGFETSLSGNNWSNEYLSMNIGVEF